VTEYAFELRLCATLEAEEDAIVSRQLGTQVAGRRVMDIVCVEPGSNFEDRKAITADRIPDLAIESDVTPGTARYWNDAFDCHPDTAEAVIERAVDIGFFERERRNGRTYLRQTTRYPDWFDTIRGIENKPDLSRPGDLETQLLTDVELGVLDEVVLATESYVTRAHENRIPDEVGIWRFDPESGDRTVLREPATLPTDEAGVEILDRTSTRTEIAIATPDDLARARRRVAERAYGKGWRTYDVPGCDKLAPDEAGLPHCPWKERLVHPTVDCGQDCDGYTPTDPPDVDLQALRDARSCWERNPPGRQREQSDLDSFL
jgi:hypothetical protein